MQLSGKMWIGGQAVAGDQAPVYAIDPSSGQRLAPDYPGANAPQIEQACAQAWQAFASWRYSSRAERAGLLERIALEIEALGDALLQRTSAETGLPLARLQGERQRTCNQLRLFARTVLAGEWLDARIDPAQPTRQPLPRADLRQCQVPLGPVLVFGASNFPLAFSVAGGDTAAALAAGCPVIVKAHPAHPGCSEMVAGAIARAVAHCGLPGGLFSLLYGAGNDLGLALVRDPRVQAVGFTGSRAAGLALCQAAQQRRQPIPVYAEMSAINPVFLLPARLQAQSEALAQGFVASLTQGAGQFCTNPGLLLAVQGPDLERFLDAAASALAASPAQTMLSPAIHQAYQHGVAQLAQHARAVASGQAATGPHQGQAQLFRCSAADWLARPALQAECFGAAALVVACRDPDELCQLATQLEGQLSATLHLDDADLPLARRLLPILESKAGRIVANGWPTGVEVCDAMVHGGPYPATSDARSTSVGSAAMQRFLRPVCYQDLPDTLLPLALQAANPLALRRLYDGQREG